MRARDPIPPLKDEIARLVVDRLDGWAQIWAADFIGTDQPRMSDLRNHRLERFSLEQLIRFLSRIGGQVTLQVTWDPRKRFIAGGRG